MKEEEWIYIDSIDNLPVGFCNPEKKWIIEVQDTDMLKKDWKDTTVNKDTTFDRLKYMSEFLSTGKIKYRVKEIKPTKPLLPHNEKLFNLWFNEPCEEEWSKITLFSPEDDYYYLQDNWYTLEELSQMEYSDFPKRIYRS